MRKLSALLVLGLWVLATAPLTSAYSGASAATYANTWVDNDVKLRNSAWKTDFGDDCTNFVSQALFAGGYDMQNVGADKTKYVNWWAQKTNGNWTNTFSWSSANNLLNFLYVDTPGGSPIAHKTPSQGMMSNKTSGGATGDVIFYDWGHWEGLSHVAIQVGYGIDPDSLWEGSLVDQHTTDREKAFWSLRPYNAEKSTTYFTIVKISTSN
jgi:cell wall-associated NlpC family hydrolase